MLYHANQLDAVAATRPVDRALNGVALALGASLAWGTSDFLGGVALAPAADPARAARVPARGARRSCPRSSSPRWQGPPARATSLYGLLAGAAGAVGLGALYRGDGDRGDQHRRADRGDLGGRPGRRRLRPRRPPEHASRTRGSCSRCIGVVLASSEEVHEARTDTRIAAGVGLALFAALCFGSSLVGLHAAAASGGDALWGTLMLRIAGIAVAVAFVVAARTRVRGHGRELVRLSPIGLPRQHRRARVLARLDARPDQRRLRAQLALPGRDVALATILLHERLSRLQPSASPRRSPARPRSPPARRRAESRHCFVTHGCGIRRRPRKRRAGARGVPGCSLRR